MFDTPVIAAPMAGGTTTPELALAAQAAGAFSFLAGGYLKPEALAGQVAQLRTAGADFGVNLFVPRSGPLPGPEREALARYRSELEPTAAALGAELPQKLPDWDAPPLQDYWADKIGLLLADPVPAVSFTFGLPPRRLVRALQDAGSKVLVSVTTVAEAQAAQDIGVDVLVVQHPDAGGHSAAFLPAGTGRREPAGTVVDLVTAVRSAVALPLVGAGGIGDAERARAVLAAGAFAVQLGTALLRTDESGTRRLHKDALADPAFGATAVTRAFTGRPARGLVNDFLTRHSAGAPAAYPEVHFLTAPLRAAAAAAGNAQALNLWAGTAWRAARSGPVRDVIEEFRSALD